MPSKRAVPLCIWSSSSHFWTSCPEISGIQSLALPESRRATGKTKEIEFTYISPSEDTPKNEGKFDLDDDLPCDDKLLETNLETPLDEMIARATKGLKKVENDQTEELLSLVFRFKDMRRVALNNDGSATTKLAQINLIPGSVPWKAKMRRYASAHLNFRHSQIRKLEKLGHVKSGILEDLGELVYQCVLIWIDDILVFDADFKGFLGFLHKSICSASKIQYQVQPEEK
jgi:hypothetical protein